MSQGGSDMANLIDLMKNDGLRLAQPVLVEGMPPMTFVCDFAPDGANADDLNACEPELPDHLREFWSISRTAKLFEDREYGQWGLEILTPQRAVEMTNSYRARRQRDFVDGDLVLGQFFGDSDLLIIRCDVNSPDYGNVLVALPLDPRPHWYLSAESFAEFLQRYAKAGGDKFWENADHMRVSDQ